MTPQDIRMKYALRNKDTIVMLQFFATASESTGLDTTVAIPFQKLAFKLVDDLPDGPELVIALRELRRTRDSFAYHYLVTVKPNKILANFSNA